MADILSQYKQALSIIQQWYVEHLYPSIVQCYTAIREKLIASGILDFIILEDLYLLIIILLCIKVMLPQRSKPRISRQLEQKIANKFKEQNTSIQIAKLYIHIFTTTIAAYRRNIDTLLERRSYARGMLIIRTVGGKVPILEEGGFYTLLYCAIAFEKKIIPFEKDKEKQKEHIRVTLGYLPTLDKHSKSDYHSYMALEAYAQDNNSIYTMRTA